MLDSITQAGADPAVAQAVAGWATVHPQIRITGSTGLSYPSITTAADSGRSRSRFRGVLSLYGSPGGEHPTLEIRVRRMCRTPPYNQRQTRDRLTAELLALQIHGSSLNPI